MIVKERLREAEENLKESALTSNLTEQYALVSYADDRRYSAELWARFFGSGNERNRLDKEELHTVCINKIYEAQERSEYVQLSSNVFAEYSLELSNLDIYVDDDMRNYELPAWFGSVAYFAGGFLLGLLIAY